MRKERSLTEIENIFKGMLGVKFIGIQIVPEGLGMDNAVLFNDLYTNSTLALSINGISQEAIKNKIIASRKTFQLK